MEVKRIKCYDYTICEENVKSMYRMHLRKIA